MSNIVTDKIIPDSGSANTLTVGGTGDSVVVLDSLNVNTLQDAGGNNIFVSDGSGTITSKNSGVSGGLNLISTQTASGSASISFTSDIDSTYDVYCFSFINMNPELSSSAHFTFNGSSDSGSNYNVTKTTTWFYAYHSEGGAGGALTYHGDYDLAQSTAYQIIATVNDDASDASTSGNLYLFSPSSTTYVKHFYSTAQTLNEDDYSTNAFMGGYFNTTSAVDAISFKFPSGNFDGTIKLYGISKS
jgi:hypothetical protein